MGKLGQAESTPTHDEFAELAPADELDLLEALQQRDRALRMIDEAQAKHDEAQSKLNEARKALVTLGVNLERLEGDG